MPAEPPVKRTFVFIDGQNLFHAAKDEDLSEVAEEVRAVVRERGRWAKIASAFPDSPTRRYRRGVNKTDWIRIDRATYDASIDPADYRPRRPSP
jgi:hypothetical protein